MKRSIKALLAGFALVGGTALAQTAPGTGGMGGAGGGMEGTTPPTGTQGQRQRTRGAEQGAQAPGAMMGTEGAAVEQKKYLTEVDLYLHDAINNTKVLYQLSQLPAGRLDRMLQREQLTNLDRAIGGAMTQVGHVRSLPEARGTETQNLGAMQGDLTQARSIVQQLRRGAAGTGPMDRAQVASLGSQLYTVLQDAEGNFSKVADATNLTRVDRLTVPEKQPVRGSEGGGAMPAPGSTTPGGMEPGGGGTEQGAPGGTQQGAPGGTQQGAPGGTQQRAPGGGRTGGGY